MTGRTHFIGIGGVGMSAIARVMHHRGESVSGSDQKSSATTDSIISEGINVAIGHDAVNVKGASLVVYSAAIPEDNPERVEAGNLGIPAISRAEMLGRLMKPYQHRVAITGTHGKTTTTSMVNMALSQTDLDPTVLIGGDLTSLGGNARVGGESLFVTEACEAFDSFLDLYPSIAVITNIDADHLDYHGTLENIIRSFEKFIDHVDDGGCVIACVDDPNVQDILKRVNKRIIGYSCNGAGDIRAEDISVDSPEASYELVRDGVRLGRVTLGVPGAQNIANSLAAVAIGFELGVSFEAIRDGLAMFKGAGRRFERIGTVNDVIIIDDYAHHPKEIEVTLTAAKQGWGRRIAAVFQPHLYSRTKSFAKEFAESLSAADIVVVTGIYAAREKPIEGVTAELISEKIEGNNVHLIPDKSKIVDFLIKEVQPGDMVITLGAGDIRTVAEDLAVALKDF